MDKVSQKNSSLWQKAKSLKKVEGPRPASRGYDYMKKEEPIRDIKLKREQSKNTQKARTTGEAAPTPIESIRCYDKEDPPTISSNLNSQRPICLSAESVRGYSYRPESNNPNKHSSQRNSRKSTRNKSGTHSRKSSQDMKKDSSLGRGSKVARGDKT